ncbi:ABC transporter substrate-binding protein [Pararobbsia silviterrae]|uniref:ABC transporter substrate-binding protein n=1 Tax=Pararobbsia silviterrae TaxID=1792498 RepID=A0A494Y884_9BURK|nr:ABC transporter substrate-binding protein [Pararobbsia silviterrae]RKP58854.1 ABC transporter substrate-binding protein [Pararobbsia silviterrae]
MTFALHRIALLRRWIRYTVWFAGLIGFALSSQAFAATPIKFILNWKYEGPQAWFFVALDKGYFAAEGLDVSFDQGDGSAGSIPKVANGSYDAGFGDLNALIELAATHPDAAPVGVFTLYNVAPFAFAVKASGPIKTLHDLEGKTVGGAVNDAALKLFPALASINHIDASRVKIVNIAPNLSAQLLERGQIDAASTYVTTFTFAEKAMGADPSKTIRFIRFRDNGMNLYANTVFFSQPFIAAHPDAVRGFVRALNHAIKDVIADPDEGVRHLVQREPILNTDLEKQKLLFTLANDMSSPEVATLGLGDVDDRRLAQSIDIVVGALGLPNKPQPERIFDRAFLPARDARIFKLTP